MAERTSKERVAKTTGDEGTVPKEKAAERIDKVQAKKKMTARAQKKKVVTLKETREEAKPKIVRKAVRKDKPSAAREGGPKVRDVGVDIKAPKTVCDDVHCPYHGNLPLRGQSFDVVVISNRMQRTAVVQRQMTRTHPKYERQLKTTHRYLAHSPTCINAQIGETVRIMECRPISKKKSFTIVGRV